MIRDNTSHRVLRIGELTRLVAGQLILISPKSTASLACTCRCLEEPVLSTLWGTQRSLPTLLKILPEETWGYDKKPLSGNEFEIVGEPSPEAWKRVWRYAAWMRQVEVDERELLGETTFRKLRLNSPAGGWFPALQDFFWHVTRSNHPYTNLFLSPRLKRISVRLSVSWSCYGAPSEFLPAVASAISALPPSALQSIQVGCEEPWIALKDLVSSVILRCGPSLEGLSSLIPLSDEAIDHLIRLPHLRTWRVTVPPPNHSASPSPLVFPPLTEFSLLGGAAHGWFSLFKCLEHGVSATQGATPLSRLKESLQFLNIENPPRLIIDTPFASTIQIFRNLVILGMRVNCHDDDNGDQCTFKLNNNDVTELAMALSQLEIFFLGIPCSKNTCHATVACLLAISVHCVKLRELELHFNTRSIVDDLKTILEDSQYEELRSLPRCPLSCLGVWKIPLVVDEPDLEAVVHGMVKVFPSLEHFQQAPYNFGWEKLSERISVLRGSDVSDSLSVGSKPRDLQSRSLSMRLPPADRRSGGA